MLKITKLFNVLDEIAPIKISQKMIEKGDYDNSGILINSHEDVESILFSLDLSIESVKKAKRNKCDTIITHHPAIYNPVKKLNMEDENSAVLLAVKSGLNVISMHLNLDMADGGIDNSLANALGAKTRKIVDYLDDRYGYGREFEIQKTTLKQFVSNVKKGVRSNRVICYGSQNSEVKKVASFCGGGAGFAFDYVKKGLVDADTIVTSDMSHHEIKYLVESGKNIVLLTHYSAENYGFYEFYQNVTDKIKDVAKGYYFEDKRFM